MIDLQNRTQHRLRIGFRLGFGLLALGVAACQTQAPRVLPTFDSPLEPMPTATAPVPSRSDLAAAALAESALASNSAEIRQNLHHLTLSDARLAPLGQDLANSTLDDPIQYREASKKLLSHGKLDPLLKRRLKKTVEGDPLSRADGHILDHRHTLFAHTFNAVAEPLGTSVFSGMTIAPYKVALSAVKWAIRMLETDPLTVPERQALTLRKHFLDAHPQAEQAPKIRGQVETAQEDLHATRRRQLLAHAGEAERSGQPRLARAYAQRAELEVPGDSQAQTIIARADKKIARQNRLRGRTLQAANATPDDLDLSSEQLDHAALEPNMDAGLSRLALHRPTAVRRVSESLLLPDSDLFANARALREADTENELGDEADFIQAIGSHEAGNEKLAWRQFDDVARRLPDRSNMARHATALVTDPWQNPYGSFLVEQARQRREETVWYLFGETAVPRFKALPQAAGYVLATPQMAQALATAPLRHLMGSGGQKPDFEKGMSVAAYRYLERFPNGAYRAELIPWLYGYEEDQENWSKALRLADFQPGFDPEKRSEIVETMGRERLKAAGKIRRRDTRSHVLRNFARDFPDSDAGASAGNLARTEVEEASPQTIRMTRGFLYENPEIAGPNGLGLREQYLDEDTANGELHPRGVVFLGGRIVEFDFVEPGGDEEAEPIRIQRPISSERLSRTISTLEEQTFLNTRLDHEAEIDPDARRDLYFERARLGLTHQVDHRPGAHSNFVYESMREKYGMVRARESILPFDLVVQGSVTDLSLGAFPRWRAPKAAPDAFLYR